MPMIYDERQTFALLSCWIGHNRQELMVLQGADLFQAMSTGVHANAETSAVADALVRRMIRGAIKMAETLPDEEDEEDEEDIDEDEEDDDEEESYMKNIAWRGDPP